MPSSTSNSEPVVPGGPWWRTWAVALLLVLLVLGGWETYWRSRGFHPALPNDQALWRAARTALAEDAPNAVVLIGSSRARCDLDAAALATALGVSRVHQLALDDCSPVPVLEHLAYDTDYRGLLLCDVTPPLFFATEGRRVDVPAAYIADYRAGYVSPADRVERELQLRCAAALVLRQERLAPERVFDAWRRGRQPTRNRETLQRDRSGALDFSGADWRTPRAVSVTPYDDVVRGAQVTPYLARVQRAVAAIQGRGGCVVFLRLPSSGSVRAKEERELPRAAYWEALLRVTGAPGIHFADVAALRTLTCPDESHVDVQAVACVTQTIAAAVRALPAVTGDQPARLVATAFH